MEPRHYIIISIVVTVVLIVSGCLIGASFQAVYIDEYALVWNKHTKSISEDVKTSGRQYVGLGKRMIKFPSCFFTLDFSDSNSITIWTADGIDLSLTISIIYQMKKENVREIYMEFDEQWISYLKWLTFTTIRDITTTFETDNFFLERTKINNLIQTEIQDMIKSKFFNAFTVTNVQLKDIILPSRFENLINSKLIELQKKEIYKIEKITAKIEKETEEVIANAQSEILQIKAVAKAEGKKTTELAIAKAFRKSLEQYVSSYKEIQSSLGLTDKELIQFIYINELSELQNAEFMLNPKNVILKQP